MNINKQKLDEIDLGKFASSIIEDEFRNYFLDNPGKEHYKLLAYFSKLYNNKPLLDIGTYKGCSSLALSYNETNQVVSFDIRHGLMNLNSVPSNVKHIVDDITNGSYENLILESPFILLDTDHDGTFEKVFYEYLKNINWKGLLMLDDIYYNDPMKDFWNNITLEKYDISEFGHWSGTGLVIFK